MRKIPEPVQCHSLLSGSCCFHISFFASLSRTRKHSRWHLRVSHSSRVTNPWCYRRPTQPSTSSWQLGCTEEQAYKTGIIKYLTLQDSHTFQLLWKLSAAVTNPSELLCNHPAGYGGCQEGNSLPGLKAPIRRTSGQAAQASTSVGCSSSNTL